MKTLAGLEPALVVSTTEAPSSFTILDDAEIEYDSIVDDEPWPITAAGHREVQLSEIIAKHGQAALRAPTPVDPDPRSGAD